MKLNKLFVTAGILLTLTVCNFNDNDRNTKTNLLGNYCSGPN